MGEVLELSAYAKLSDLKMHYVLSPKMPVVEPMECLSLLQRCFERLRNWFA